MGPSQDGLLQEGATTPSTRASFHTVSDQRIQESESCAFEILYFYLTVWFWASYIIPVSSHLIFYEMGVSSLSTAMQQITPTLSDLNQH